MPYGRFNLFCLSQTLAETCVFAYLGLAIFSFRHLIKPALIVWCIVSEVVNFLFSNVWAITYDDARRQILTLLGRAANIYSLTFLTNFFREHKITRKMQFIMWFSGWFKCFCCLSGTKYCSKVTTNFNKAIKNWLRLARSSVFRLKSPPRCERGASPRHSFHNSHSRPLHYRVPWRINDALVKGQLNNFIISQYLLPDC